MRGNFCLKAGAENDRRLKSLKAGGTLVNGDSSATSRISQEGSFSIGKGKRFVESQQKSLKTSWKTRVLQGVEEGIREGIADLFWGVVSKSGGTS